MPAWTYGADVKESCGDLRWADYKFERGGHTFSAGIAWNTIRLTDQLVHVRGSLFMEFPGDLELPMDTYRHVSRRKVNQNPVTKPGLKQIFVVVVWAKK